MAILAIPSPSVPDSAERLFAELLPMLPSPDSRQGTQTLHEMERPEGRYQIVFVPALPPARAGLSGRELEVARLVAQGLSNREIAARLRISNWTVCSHLRRIFHKLDVGTRAAMVTHLHRDRLLG